jgi:hypothetical protein
MNFLENHCERFVYFTDLQAHKYKAFIDPKSARNSRMLDALYVVNYVIDYSVNNDIPVVVFGGDLVEQRNEVDVELMVALRAIFRVAKNQFKRRIYLLNGNHDMTGDLKHSVLSLMEPYAYTVNEPMHLTKDVALYPYVGVRGQNFQDLKSYLKKDKARLRIMHYGLMDVPFNSTFLSGEPLGMRDVPSGITMCGHFHKRFTVPGREDKDAIIFIGASQFTDRNEAWQKPVFADINLKPDIPRIKQVWTGAPIYAPFRVNSIKEYNQFLVGLNDPELKEVLPHLHLEIEMPSKELTKIDVDVIEETLLQMGFRTVRFCAVSTHTTSTFKDQEILKTFSVMDAVTRSAKALKARRAVKTKVVSQIEKWM